MLSPEPLDRIASYLKGELSAEEERELLVWAEAQPENRQLLDNAVRIWQVTGRQPEAFQPDVEAAWQRFRQQIEGEQTLGTRNQERGRPAKIQPLWSLLRVAAAVLGLVSLGYWAITYLQPDEKQWVVQQTGNGRKVVQLADGSRVQLSQNSTLRYGKTFGEEPERTVYLTGEAFFEVARNPERPFVIRSARARTQVLGTSFLVRAYPQEAKEVVSVLTGRVSVSPEGKNEAKPTLLLPGERATVAGDLAVLKTSIPDTNFWAWKTNRLTFADTPLQTVLATAETHFGGRFRVENDNILNCRFTGTFEQATLTEFLDVVTVSLNLTYVQRENEYVLSGTGCQ